MLQKEMKNAVWLYMWAKERVTGEIEIDGVVYDVVNRGEVTTYAEIAVSLHKSERTTRAYMKHLKELGVIHVIRTFRGIAILLSKKDGTMPTLSVQREERGKNLQKEEEKVQPKGRERNTSSNKEAKTKQVTPTKVDHKGENDILSKKINKINYLFNALIHKNQLFDQKDVACVKEFFQQGMSVERVMAYIQPKYEEILRNDPTKCITTIRYFHTYVLQQYKASNRSFHRQQNSHNQAELNEWKKEANEMTDAQRQALMKEALQHVRGR